MENISLVAVLDVISDQNALILFKTMAQTSGNSDLLRTKLNITRKQYYSRISSLLKTGLVKRTGGRYSLTVFGEIVYEATTTLEKAFSSEYYWKLKALDSFDSTSSQNHVMSSDERNKIIQVLLKDDHNLRKILSSTCVP